MSLSERSSPFNLRRFLLASTAGLALLSLGGCSFTPVYSAANVGSDAKLLLTYALPNSRLEQIVYQELAARLGRSDSADAAQVSVAVSSGSRRVNRSASGTNFQLYEVKLTGTLNVLSSGLEPETLLTRTRVATAQYEVGGQSLADAAAQKDGEERAARELAEIFRLLILSELAAGSPTPQQ